MRFALRLYRATGDSVRSLAYASRLVLGRALPVALITAGCCAIVHAIAVTDPQRGFFAAGVSIDILIIKAQRDRAARLPAPDVAFFGDSSCLMGIDVPMLRRALHESIESFCTLAFTGPREYGALIDRMVSRGAVPKRLVLVFNPIQFQRKRAWDAWIDLANGQPPASPTRLGWALDYARRKWLDRVLYEPLPGMYAQYYGGARALTEMIETWHGSAVDPLSGLEIASLEQFRKIPDRLVARETAPGAAIMNESFRAALGKLQAAVARVGANRTYVIVTPMPHRYYHGPTVADLANSKQRIAADLGIAPDQVLRSPRAMPDRYFSSYAHLNRWGRELYTEALSELMKGRL